MVLKYFKMSSRPLDKGEPPRIIFETPNVKIAKAPMPPVSSSASGEKPLFQGGIPQKLKDKQKLFQKPDGVPVYLKGGPFDRVLFGLTLAIGAVSFALATKFFYEAAYPKKT